MKKIEGKAYSCPMHPEIVRDKPGICPECGMALVPEHAGHEDHVVHSPGKSGESGSHDKHAGHRKNIFALKFWVSLALAVPVVLYSELPEKFFGWAAPAFPYSQFLPAVLGSAIFFYGGWVFVASAWRELRARLPGMMTLIALAIFAAYSYSIYETYLALRFGADAHTLFWELATLITVMLLGHWIEMRAVQGAQGALRELAKLLPDTAEVIRGDETALIPLSELREGDLLLIKPGAKIPADGEVVDGRSELDEALVTGESKPVEKGIGENVIAGSTNGDGMLKVKVTKIGERTFLAGIMRLVAEAQASKSRLQVLSDRAAFFLTVIAVGAGIATFVAWMLVARADAGFAIERLVAVLVIACPHALGLAVPLVASISTTLAARNGLLVRERRALEAARGISAVLFDKTGTLTKGEFGVERMLPAANVDQEKLLALAAAVDRHSEHPIARAIVSRSDERGLRSLDIKDFRRIPGKGSRAIADGIEVMVGSESILRDENIPADGRIKSEADRFESEGKTVVHVVAARRHVGAIVLSDIIREESREAVHSLKKMGLKIAMITGDSEEVAAWVSKELGIDEYFARVLPEDKADKVKVLQKRGLKVAMVGDGLNDAPALMQADIGIAVGAGTNVAIESAGIILIRNDPRDIPKIIVLSRLTYRKMLQNLFWATAYNLAALPLAAGVLASRGIVLQPAVSAIFMSLSTVIVAFNAVLLRRARL